MKIKKLLRAAAKSGEIPGLATLCLFAVATGGAALLNDAGGGDPRFTAFAFCLCALGALALVCLIALIVDAVRKSGHRS